MHGSGEKFATSTFGDFLLQHQSWFSTKLPSLHHRQHGEVDEVVLDQARRDCRQRSSNIVWSSSQCPQTSANFVQCWKQRLRLDQPWLPTGSTPRYSFKRPGIALHAHLLLPPPTSGENGRPHTRCTDGALQQSTRYCTATSADGERLWLPGGQEMGLGAT